MDFLVDFEITVPEGRSEIEVKERQDDEASAVARFAAKGHVLRIWKRPLSTGASISADLRYSLSTEHGALRYVRATEVRHGCAEVLARPSRGEDVDASEYTFRTTTRIETAAPGLHWLNNGVFVSVGGRQPTGVTYKTYLVG
jgi:hypothetical protein